VIRNWSGSKLRWIGMRFLKRGERRVKQSRYDSTTGALTPLHLRKRLESV
jgi:hypothetical protein